jgi:hypothetical protein
LKDVVESIVEAEADGLPGWGAAGNSLNMRGQVVATWRSLQALPQREASKLSTSIFRGERLVKFKSWASLRRWAWVKTTVPRERRFEAAAGGGAVLGVFLIHPLLIV